MDYQEKLTNARRAALWKALDARDKERASKPEPPQWAKRDDQLTFSLMVLAALAALGAMGVAAGMTAAILEAMGWW